MIERMKDKEGFFGDLFTWIGSKLSSLWATAEPEVIATFRTFFSTFEGAALAAVVAEAPKVISGADKFANASSTVTSAVLAAGWQASTGAIQTLVQDAYISWQATQPAAHGIVVAPAK